MGVGVGAGENTPGNTRPKIEKGGANIIEGSVKNKMHLTTHKNLVCSTQIATKDNATVQGERGKYRAVHHMNRSKGRRSKMQMK